MHRRYRPPDARTLQTLLNRRLDRRRFLRRSGQGALLLGTWPLLSSCGGSETASDRPPQGGRDFLFAVISDTHMLQDPNALQHLVFSVTAEILNAHDPAIDFVILTGDVVDELPSDDPAYYEQHADTELDQLQRLRSELSMPLHLVMGNHDYYTARGLIPIPTPHREPRERLFMDRAGMPGPYHAFEHRGVKFCCLNSMQQDPAVAWEPNAVGTFGPEQVEWLRGELSDGMPAFLFQHHALATDVTTHAGISSWIPFEVPRAEGQFPKYALTPYRDYTDPIYDLLREHREQVRAVFFGHSHLFLHDHFEGIPLFMTDSMKFPSQSEYEGKPMRYHVIRCEAGTGSFTVCNAYMIPYLEAAAATPSRSTSCRT